MYQIYCKKEVFFIKNLQLNIKTTTHYYELIKTDKYIKGIGHTAVYGLQVCRPDNYEKKFGGGEAFVNCCTVCKIEDISSNKDTVLRLLNLLEKNLVSPIHFKDVVLDYLNTELCI